MKRTYTALWCTRLSADSHRRTCGYWYTVTQSTMAHTAFRSREALDLWLSDRGLMLPAPMDNPEGDWCGIVGTYREHVHMIDPAEFDKIEGLQTRDMSNGEWTKAIISTDADGIRTVHTLNPNIRTRTVYDYAESNLMMRQSWGKRTATV